MNYLQFRQKFAEVAMHIYGFYFIAVIGLMIYKFIDLGFNWISGLAILTLFGPFLWLAYRSRRGELKTMRSFAKAIKSEATIYQALHYLTPSLVLYRNVRFPEMDADVDVILVGENQVLALEIKSHSGTVSFDGQTLLLNGLPFAENKDFLKLAKSAAARLSHYLHDKTGYALFIRPIIVFEKYNCTVQMPRNPVDGIVYVVHKRELPNLINQLMGNQSLTFNRNLLLNALNELKS